VNCAFTPLLRSVIQKSGDSQDFLHYIPSGLGLSCKRFSQLVEQGANVQGHKQDTAQAGPAPSLAAQEAMYCFDSVFAIIPFSDCEHLESRDWWGSSLYLSDQDPKRMLLDGYNGQTTKSRCRKPVPSPSPRGSSEREGHET
jgi:hypothetical protein